ncbi:MAG: leucine-rich repeat domain-containing protein [Holosporaceae bacterium]|nr:leucine-rich repeat domain-containing protein [Holosporaceae bacterium]
MTKTTKKSLVIAAAAIRCAVEAMNPDFCQNFPQTSQQNDVGVITLPISGVKSKIDCRSNLINIDTGCGMVACAYIWKTVQINNRVTVIPDNCFLDQGYNIRGAAFLESSPVVCFGNYAFCRTGLETISIPRNVEHLGDGCFAGCESLEKVIFNPGSRLKTTGVDIFADCRHNVEVFVPENKTASLFLKQKNCRVTLYVEQERSKTDLRDVDVEIFAHKTKMVTSLPKQNGSRAKKSIGLKKCYRTVRAGIVYYGQIANLKESLTDYSSSNSFWGSHYYRSDYYDDSSSFTSQSGGNFEQRTFDLFGSLSNDLDLFEKEKFPDPKVIQPQEPSFSQAPRAPRRIAGRRTESIPNEQSGAVND